MALLEFSIYPLDRGQSVSPYVARCLEIVDHSGLDYQCHAMGTVLEGEVDQLLGVVRQCFEALKTDCERIECGMRLDYRRDYVGQLRGKVASLEEKLGHPIKK
jgi:uncharacterized protein (TIGR00106 family)